jgi:hypothetical protein
MAELCRLLTPRQQARADQLLEQLQGEVRWHGELPVLLLERCWLRLQVVSVQQLAQRLPPDASGEAPELVRYRDLQQQGFGPLEAQERCWREFGREACSQALQRFWQHQERGNQGWTLAAYLDLLARYKRQMAAPGSRALPLLVLARQGSEETHTLRWCWPATPPMRHTCP